MTDPTGRSFLSYRRSRAGEAELLIAAQHDLGIPTWQDISDLEEEPTADRLEQILHLPETANAVLWLTPEVAGSPTIREIEAPAILRRVRGGDDFFVVPVAAGGLDYAGAAAVLDSRFSLADLQHWNLRRAGSDPIGPQEAATVARRVLDRRLAATHRRLPTADPLRLRLYTRTAPPFEPGVALTLDWTRRFQGRVARPGAWDDQLLPALRSVVEAVGQRAPGRAVVASGLASIPAATALGCAFLAPRGLSLSWQQLFEDQSFQTWSLAATPEPSGFTASREQGVAGARDLAVLVSVADQVEPAFNAARSGLTFRSVLTISRSGDPRQTLASAGQAVHVAQLVRDAMREARRDFQQVGCIHLFMAVPLGLAMMIGQLLNTWDTVQTYEQVPDGGTGRYEPAALLRPMA